MFYSINYHHWGDAKKWYGVPGSAGHLFEEAFRKALPGHFERQPDLLFHLTTLLSPRILHQYDVPVYSATQHEGEFVITFPNAYHGGFNMGFNCAEAVNFAPADWFRFGSAGTERFRTFRKPSVVSHEGLLLKVGCLLCCAVLCCAVLCCAVLRCAALPYAVPFLTTHFHEHSAQCSCIRAWVCPDLSPHAALCRWNAHNHLLWLSRLPRLTTALRHASGQSRTCSVSLLRRGSGAASFGLLVGCLCLPLLCTSDNTLQLCKSVALP